MAAIYVLNDAHLSPFLTETSDQVFYDEQSVTEMVTPWLRQQNFTEQTAVHFYRSSCRCNYLINKHLIELKKNAKVKLLTIDLDKVNLSFNLPATPALMVVSETNQPKYFGAYGFGQFCQPTGESIWARLIERSNQPSIFLNTIGKGCFCNETTDTFNV
ncbi:hypothetical protein FLL45_18310 [Aliikangiella marina]|uniref:DUF6436 domain-containing protein n=2 Tax=Aliikangiella marina TaxID=1712262 RepID=A0A545T4M4_9GAMM|nr:hypothetical protein FLL45_18310 [Aliikangiella marina]